MNRFEEVKKRTEWFQKDRFGMFIHWGLYAIPGRGEWVMSAEKIPAEEYEQFFEEFDPVDYDPGEWARMAKEAGMKYVVMTAKHHDGFCLFDTKLTDYKSTNTKARRDLVREFVDAVRAEGLKVGLYYSLIDWHHKDFPKYADINHPMRGNEAYKDEKIDFDNYLKFMHGQIEELVTNYGKIDILWFDYSYEDLRGEKWKATDLIHMVRAHQPDVLIDNRLETSGEGFGSLVTEQPSEFCGDFVSPEQIIPPEGIMNYRGEQVPWELCLTMNNNWGYNPTDHDYKEASLLIHKLVECVSKGGNMILNVGPDARGNINEESRQILHTFGGWLKKNGDSIYDCINAGIPKPEWGRYTRKGNKLYAHIFECAIGPLALTGVPVDAVAKIRRLADSTEVKRGESWITASYQDIPFACLGEIPHFTYPLTDAIDTVLEITLKEEL
ncbi:MAG: alpha-L-fucosidase [Lachnospiraceae bacterium]|nr:alpha-L-fucosidase [Lachnospiraceae bacterium]